MTLSAYSKLKKIFFFLLIATFFQSCASWFESDSPPPILPGGIKSIKSSFPKQSSSVYRADQFLARFKDYSTELREEEILRQVRVGAVPRSMRNLIPVLVDTPLTRSKKLKIYIWVLPDYFSVGTDANWMRMPLTPITAQKIADAYGLSLPTTKIVDILYQKAHTRLSPRTIPPSSQMTSLSTFFLHNGMLKSQLPSNLKSWNILAGHKKDVVITNRLDSQPNRVAIYGWHRGPGMPIQPLSLVHGNEYADYSHGIRFIWNNVSVNGKLLAYSRFLRDPVLAPILSNEGLVRSAKVHF